MIRLVIFVEFHHFMNSQFCQLLSVNFLDLTGKTFVTRSLFGIFFKLFILYLTGAGDRGGGDGERGGNE